MSSARMESTRSRSASGISAMRWVRPLSPSKYDAFLEMMSHTPAKLSSSPMGSWIGSTVRPSFLRICWRTKKGSEP